MVLGSEWYKDFNGTGTFFNSFVYFISFVLGSDREFTFVHLFIRSTNYGRIIFSSRTLCLSITRQLSGWVEDYREGYWLYSRVELVGKLGQDENLHRVYFLRAFFGSFVSFP